MHLKSSTCCRCQNVHVIPFTFQVKLKKCNYLLPKSIAISRKLKVLFRILQKKHCLYLEITSLWPMPHLPPSITGQFLLLFKTVVGEDRTGT